MKVIVNGRFLLQPSTGVQNYARGIVSSLIKLGYPVEVVVPPSAKAADFTTKTIGLFKGALWEQTFLPLYVKQQKDSLLLNLCNTAPLALKNQIVTIHDLAFEQEANWYSKQFKRWYKFLIPRICKKAKIVFTVSGFSQKELIKYYKLSPSKIIVIPPAISDLTLDDSDIPQYDYVVLTGANNPRKNAKWVIDNVEILKKNKLKLVLLFNSATVYNELPLHVDEDIICLRNLPPKKYYSLLKHAKALLCPSLYEGFGIPVLESLSLGTPVVASNIPPFKESFGEIPIYFEPGDINSFAKAIADIKTRIISEQEINQLKNTYNYDISAKLIARAIKNT
jgi:glycosyltransferase involved in cell wall biosynthesis